MNKIDKIENIKKMTEEIITKIDADLHTRYYVIEPFLPSSNFYGVYDRKSVYDRFSNQQMLLYFI